MLATPATPPVRKIKRLFYIAIMALLLASIGTTAYAQETPVTARVTYLAGPNVYLDAGRDRGILPGDTLAVYRDGALAGRLAIVSSIADRSVVTFAGAPFAVTRGEVLHLRVPGQPVGAPPPEPPQEAAPEPPAAPPERPAAYPSAAEAAAPTRQPRAGPHASGRVMLSLNTLRSSTQWGSAGAGRTARTFATPSMNLHLDVRGLPQGMTLRTRLRADYRYSSLRPIEPALAVHAYQFLLARDFTAFSIQAGRFSNPYAAYEGYWDGALLHVGSRRAGFGTAVGFLPDRSNEGFSPDMPRYAGFAHVELGERAGLRYAAEVSYNEIRPSNGLLDHRFAGLSHRLRWGGLSLRHDLQLDRDPETGQWIASRFNLRGAAAPHRRLLLTARYTVRQPYSIYRTQRVVSYRRDQAGAGASLQLDGLSLGADVAFNFVEDAVRGRVADGRTLGGYVQVPRTGVLDLGFSANASYWSADKGTSFFLNTGVSRDLGAVRARLQYQFYRTATLAEPLLTHGVALHASAPLGRGFYGSAQARLQQGTTLRSFTLYTSLWYAF